MILNVLGIFLEIKCQKHVRLFSCFYLPLNECIYTCLTLTLRLPTKMVHVMCLATIEIDYGKCVQ